MARSEGHDETSRRSHLHRCTQEREESGVSDIFYVSDNNYCVFRIVCFASHEDLRRAVDKFQGKEINGRRLKLYDDSIRYDLLVLKNTIAFPEVDHVLPIIVHLLGVPDLVLENSTTLVLRIVTVLLLTVLPSVVPDLSLETYMTLVLLIVIIAVLPHLLLPITVLLLPSATVPIDLVAQPAHSVHADIKDLKVT